MSPAAVDALYRAHHHQLHRVLRARFHTVAVELIEDSVQFAFLQALTHTIDVARDDQAFSWLYVVAFREICRHTMRDRARLVPLDSIDEPRCEVDLDSAIDAKGSLRALAEHLTARQLHALGYQAFGLTYAETASVTGWTLRTVERQTLRGKARARLTVAA